MASKITLAFESTFKGEGAAKANKALKETGNAANKLNNAAQQCGSKLSELDGTAGKFASAAMGVVNGFKEMGIAGGAAALVVSGITLAGQYFVNQAEKMEAAAKKAGASVRAVFTEKMQEILGGVRDKMAEVSDGTQKAIKDFNDLTAAAAKVEAAVSRTTSASGKAEIQNLEIEKLNAVIAEQTEAGKAVVAAEYDVAIAEQNAANVAEEQTALVTAAKKREVAAEERVRLAKENEAAADEAYAAALNAQATTAAATGKEKDAIDAAVIEAEKNLKAAHEQVFNAEQESALAAQDHNTALINAKTAREAATAKVVEETQALEALRASEEKAAQAREAEWQASEEAASKQNQAAALTQQANDAQTTRDTAASNYSDQIAALQQSLALAEEVSQTVNAGMAADKKYHQGINGQGYKYHTDGNGAVTDFEDFQRTQRYNKRAERDAATQQKHDDYLQDKYDKIKQKEKDGDYVSDADKKAAAEWDKYVAQRDKSKTKSALETLTEKMEKELSKMDENIEKIHDKIKELGLK